MSAAIKSEFQENSSNINESTEVTFEESIGLIPDSGEHLKYWPRQRNLSVESSVSSAAHHSNNHVKIDAPDGGWGWVVVFASFMINLIADGVSFSFGLIYIELLKVFGESKSKTSWVGSLFLSIPLITGPIASALTDRFGCRRVAITGAIMSSGGFVCGYFATTLEHLFIAFSISGFGLALCYVTSIVIVAYYFEKRRSLATGLAVSGSGFGTFLFAPLTVYLLKEFQWRVTLLILAGVFLNITLFGALMRDINVIDSSDDDDDSEHDFNCDTNNFDPLTYSNDDDKSNAFKRISSIGRYNGAERDYEEINKEERLCSSLVHIPTYISHRGSLSVNNEVISELSSRKGGNLQRLIQRYPKLIGTFMTYDDNGSVNKAVASPVFGKVISKNEKVSEGLNSNSKSLNKCGVKKGILKNTVFQSDPHAPNYLRNLKLQRGSLTYRGAMLNIKKYRLKASSAPDIYRNSMVTISEERSCGFIYDLKDILFDMVNLSLFKSFRYTLFCLSNFLLYACLDVPYVYFPDQAISSGSTDNSASYLISIIGILNTFGVVMVGYIGDKPWIDTSLLYSGFIAIGGVSMAVIPWVSNYFGMALSAAFYGFAISANYALVSVILVKIITLDAFTNAYGLLLLVQGFGSLIGPPIAGWLYDISGNYNSTFYITGISIFISGVMQAPVAILNTCVTLEESSSLSTELSRPYSPSTGDTNVSSLIESKLDSDCQITMLEGDNGNDETLVTDNHNDVILNGNSNAVTIDNIHNSNAVTIDNIRNSISIS